MKNHFLISLLIFTLAFHINTQLLAIDFGTQYIKAAIVHSGAGKAFQIVQNGKSERKFLNALGFYNEERLYQSDALPKRTKLPENCFIYSRFLVDLVDQPNMVQVVKKDLILDYVNEQTQDQFMAEFVLKNFPEQTSQVTLLEIFAMIFRYVKADADKFAKASIKDVVLVLPNYYNIHQRNFFLQAAAVAEIDILSIITENTGAAINYALNQRNSNKTQNVLFYNVGANGLQMTLVQYRQVITDKSPKGVESIFVKDDFGKPYVGGLRLDAIIANYFSQKFQQQHKKPLSKRGFLKLIAQSNKVKQTLSSNKQSMIFVQGIMDGIDFHSKITRTQFQARSAQVFKQLTAPIKRFLFDNDMRPEDIDYVELIGGGSRIPKLQSIIQEIIQDETQKVGTHINGDEAAALGGAFFAANSSKKFKVKGIDLYDGFNFQINLVLRNLDQTITQGDQNYFFKNATIFKKKSRYGLNKQVNFKCQQNLIVQLYKSDSSGQQQLLKSFKIDKIQNINQTDYKVSLTFTIDPLQIVILKDTKFTYKKDQIQTYLQKVRKNIPKNNTKQQNSQQASNQQSNEQNPSQSQEQITDQQRQVQKEAQKKVQKEVQKGVQNEAQKDVQKQLQDQNINDQETDTQSKQKQDSNQTKKQKAKKKKKEKIEYETVQRNKTVTKKYEKELKFQTTFNIKKAEQQLNQKSARMLKQYEAVQQKKKILAQAKNSLQALIYEAKDKLENQEFLRYSSKNQQQKIQQLLQEKQTWHDQSTSIDPNDYKKQTKQLHRMVDLVKKRIVQKYQRSHVKKRALQIIQEYTNLTTTIQKGKQWITQQEIQTLANDFSHAKQKIESMYQKMESTQINEDCVYLNKDMIKQAQDAKQKYFVLKAKPKPKVQKKEEKESKSQSVESQQL